MPNADENSLAPEFIVDSVTPPSPISDDDLDHGLRQAYWTIGEAIFVMQGFDAPLEDYSFHHLIDHFPNNYKLAVREIEAGNIETRERVRAGQRRIIASPEEWLKLAPRIGVKVDPRIEQILKTSLWSILRKQVGRILGSAFRSPQTIAVVSHGPHETDVVTQAGPECETPKVEARRRNKEFVDAQLRIAKQRHDQDISEASNDSTQRSEREGECRPDRDATPYRPRRPIYRIAADVLKKEFDATGEFPSVTEVIALLPEYDNSEWRAFKRYDKKNGLIHALQDDGEPVEIPFRTFEKRVSAIRSHLKG